jgi:hypothetical protein
MLKRAILAALLLWMPAVNAQQLSENDIFALYCMGAVRVTTARSAQNSPNARPTGYEQTCNLICEAEKAEEEGLNRVKRYLTARGYLSSAQRGVAAQLEFTVRSGEDDERRCLEWQMNNAEAVSAGRDEPQFCKQTDKCADLCRLPM